MESVKKLFQRKKPHPKANKGCLFVAEEQKALATKDVALFISKFPNDAQEYLLNDFKCTVYGEEEF